MSSPHEQLAKAVVSQWLNNPQKILCEPNSPYRNCIKLGTMSVSTHIKLSDPGTPRGSRVRPLADPSMIDHGGAALSAPPSSRRRGSHSRHPSRQRSVEDLQERAEAAECAAAEQAKRANDAMAETCRLHAELEAAQTIELITAELRSQLGIVGGSLQGVASKACEQLGVKPSPSAAQSLCTCHTMLFGAQGSDILEVIATSHSGDEMAFRTADGKVFCVIVPPGVVKGSSFKLQIASRLLSPRTTVDSAAQPCRVTADGSRSRVQSVPYDAR